MIDPFKIFGHGCERNKIKRLKEGQTTEEESVKEGNEESLTHSK